MSVRPPLDSEVFSAREIARASGPGVATADAEALLSSGAVVSLDGRFVGTDEALRAVLILRGLPAGPTPQRQLFSPALANSRRPGGPLTASGILHATAFGLVVLMLGTTGRAIPQQERSNLARLVFLVKPGPGGGGGGGGLRQPEPARPALLKGTSALKSPVPVERAIRKPIPDPPVRPRPTPPPVVQPIERPIEPPPPVAKPDPVPPVVAPVVSAPAESRTQIGSLETTAPPTTSQGSGNGGGAGTGGGTGTGEGTGPGIGPGSGGGTGGGPYRPGSGIVAPDLVHEVKPDYTEEARRRGISGEVLLEIVVRSDGRVGNVRLLQGLGAGLDERAVDAVRQWRFTPARRLGTPVDVLVEVAVEFRQR
jgi:periplasmic protein TonB